MRNWLVLGGFSLLAACSSSKGGTQITCGDGTTLQGDMCVGSGSGSSVTCGSGTHLDGTTCVPDAPNPTGAPTIATITPDHAGATGYVLFTIDGTGFAGSDVTDLHVYFGDATPGTPQMPNPCEAQIGMATPTEITGEVPPMCDLSVVVTVTTNIGMATTAFHYDALFAADGDGGAAFGQAGDLYIIDPYAALWFDLGAIVDSAGTGYGITGLAFAGDGTLYGATTGTSPGDSAGKSQLVTIAPVTANGPTVTVVGNLVDATGKDYYVTDIKMSGTTLYGWGIQFGTATKASLVTIDTTNGKVTKVGTQLAASFSWNAGLAIDAGGVVAVTPAGAGSDSDTTFPGTGELDSVDTTSGALSNMASLNYPIGAPVNAMAYVGTYLVAAVDNGTYGAYNDQSTSGFVLYGETLTVIDPTNETISPAFELPAQVGAQSHIDALDTAPATVTLGRRLPRAQWQSAAPATQIHKP